MAPALPVGSWDFVGINRAYEKQRKLLEEAPLSRSPTERDARTLRTWARAERAGWLAAVTVDPMIHQVSGGAQGTASDVERTVEYMFKLKKRLIKIIAHHTGKDEETVKNDSDRDYYITAEEAKTYGLVDEVVKSRKELKTAAEIVEQVQIETKNL